MAKKQKNVKIFGFRLSDTTALMMFLFSIMFLFSGAIGILITMFLELTIETLIFTYLSYTISIGIGIWLLLKSLKYKKIRK